MSRITQEPHSYNKILSKNKILLAGHFWPASSASCRLEQPASENEKNKVTKILKASIAVCTIKYIHTENCPLATEIVPMAIVTLYAKASLYFPFSYKTFFRYLKNSYEVGQKKKEVR